jgi:hypothetical protein
MILAFERARIYWGQFNPTNSLELFHTRVDHGIGGLL